MLSVTQVITRFFSFPDCIGNKKEEKYAAAHFSQSLSNWEQSALPGEDRCHAAAIIRDCLSGGKTELNLSGLNLCSLPDGLAGVIRNTVISIDVSDNNIRNPALLTDLLSLKDSAELIYHDNPACCFAGNNYELKVLSEKTPIAFQWHVMNKDMESEKYPVINTNQYPYLDNILNTCKTESGRIIGLLISGDVSEKHKASLSELQTQYSNLKVIYTEQLDSSNFFRIKAVDCIKKTIAAGKSNNIHQEDIDMLYSELDDVCSSDPDITLFDEFSESGGHAEMDFYRNLLLFNGGGVFLSPDDDNHGALIYLDCDMIINKPLGEIVLVDGIGIYNKSGVMENGIIAVDRARHPVLEAGMDIMENDRFKAHPYYDGICGGLRQHFSYSQRIHGKGKLAEFIAFPVDNMSPDTSTRTGASSW